MKIHFVGIGGIGVSALAKYYVLKGHQVSGSDLAASEITNGVKKIGVKVHTGKHQASNLPKNVDLVIHSPAVSRYNPELQKAIKLRSKNRKLKVRTYPQALGDLTKQHYTIAVTGTHGKSTVTSMLGLLLTRAGLDPTVIVGTKLKEFNDSNCRVGKSKYLVIEACEHFASFLNYYPDIIVFTTLEEDHLDYYKNLKNIIKTFKQFSKNLKKGGFLVVNGDETNLKKVFPRKTQNMTKYSLRNKEAKELKEVIYLPGKFNVANSLAALKVAQILDIPDEISFKSLSVFKGSWRRFQTTKISKPKRYTLIEDYGHHPTELLVTLQAAREKYPKKQIWCIFQPHQHHRTHLLFEDFVKALSKSPVDKLIVTDIYDVAGRETKVTSRKVSSQKLVKAVNKESVIHLSKTKLKRFLNKNLKGREVLVVMGAGDIYNFSSRLRTQNQ